MFMMSAYALTVEEPLSNSTQESIAKAIFRELRCVVCQGESIADSPADVARDMRREVRAQVAAGKNTDEIKMYFVERYGDFVLMRPPFAFATALLWLGPILILGFAFRLARGCFRKDRHVL